MVQFYKEKKKKMMWKVRKMGETRVGDGRKIQRREIAARYFDKDSLSRTTSRRAQQIHVYKTKNIWHGFTLYDTDKSEIHFV